MIKISHSGSPRLEAGDEVSSARDEKNGIPAALIGMARGLNVVGIGCG
jgi:hypothetical protein